MPIDCLPATGGGFSLPALVLGVLLLVGGLGVVFVLRRRGRKAAGAAALAVILFGALIGIGATPQAANAACGTVAPPTVPEPASLGSFVWSDANANGVQDAGESGVPGIQVTLLDSTTDLPVTTGFGGATINPVQTTDANGQYSFTNLAAGSYIVKMNITTPVPMDTVTMSLAGSGAGITFDVLDSDGAVVFDYPLPTNLISNGMMGTFFGTGHTVKVLQGTTDVTSTISFFTSSVVPTPMAPSLSAAGQGTNSALDSDFDPATGLTAPIVLTSGENNLDIDGGLRTALGITGVGGPSGPQG
ncbi:MAG TPA: SdrD B-like domain-containing protein [Galbitalea sp.]|nr:SdrD B-like domain-containing protein [Galbitalea sp.]